jgi:nucleotide-binding universal stress UspA family protein
MKALIATDGSDIAVEAARRAREVLAPACSVVLLYVITDIPGDEAGGFEGPVESPEEMERRWAHERAEADAALECTADVVASSSVERLVETGDAPGMICAIAERERADVIVVGSHGRGLLGRIVHLGSVSESVIRHAPCPVLVVREATG